MLINPAPMDALDKLKGEKLCPSSPIPPVPVGDFQKTPVASRKASPLLADQNQQQRDKASDECQADPDNCHCVITERHWKKQGRNGVSCSGECTADLRDGSTPWSSKTKPWADSGIMVFRDEALSHLFPVLSLSQFTGTTYM